ncbi:hypothetical protein [Gimesia sp.]|uniref:hypothetical protein n=1 Tax=Gimesia sp. TaxID=2024833 RepID=UPI000C4072AD|nr:hypothetical protein [Gimesia sp.]MAX36999.1 hypothetical protein [Gimesia sp.]HAH47088.1 hypothetical protein [Planctomycetaceae bacterium]HBL48146.1 hypothetical protein [Planctomycetaceae bacterium]
MNALARGISRLEAISAEFNYDLARQYAICVKEYLRVIRRITHDTPIFNVSGNFEIELATDVKERLEAFLSNKKDYAPTTKHICYWYLLELHSMDLGLKPNEVSVYEPLIQILEAGGDFYEHNGAICLRDAVMIPFMR